MKEYIEETLKFIESDEMQSYLRECIAQSDWDWRTYCAEIVSFAPAPLERKIPVLDLIAMQTVKVRESNYDDPAIHAKSSRIALDERYNNPPGTMFWLRDWYYHEEGCIFDDAFFSDFDAAIRFIQEQQAETGEPDNCEYLSHSIDKYIPGEDGKLEEYCTWILNSMGEIWYFDYKNNKYKPDDWQSIFDYGGDSLYIPVPFQPGDIITADCRPFAKELHVLILEIGDHDCCGLQCIFIYPNGKMYIAAFKHNSFLRGRFLEGSHISGLYRAACYQGDLKPDEAPLSIISNAIKANPALGSIIWNYIFENETYDKDDDNDYPGVTWEQLKNQFDLGGV